jgi:hypothetical protein
MKRAPGQCRVMVNKILCRYGTGAKLAASERFHAIGTDRWLRNSGDLIQSDRNPLQGSGGKITLAGTEAAGRVMVVGAGAVAG